MSIRTLDYRPFLKERYDFLKATKPQFSARYLARTSGVSSPAYFHMVVSGRRKLSLEYAKRFARGLSLNENDRAILIRLVELEKSEKRERRLKLLAEIDRLQKKKHVLEGPSHLEILSDPINLKLYLLAQSANFHMDIRWMRDHLHPELLLTEVEHRANALIHSGLWRVEGDRVKTIAPTVYTGDERNGHHLARSHRNLIERMSKALHRQGSHERMITGRTFLFDRHRILEVVKRINRFKDELEVEFETLDSTDVFHLEIGFFDLIPIREELK